MVSGWACYFVLCSSCPYFLCPIDCFACIRRSIHIQHQLAALLRAGKLYVDCHHLGTIFELSLHGSNGLGIARYVGNDLIFRQLENALTIVAA